jgi:hypothetical protein
MLPTIPRRRAGALIGMRVKTSFSNSGVIAEPSA